MLGELEESIGISFRIIPPILLIIWAILYNKNKKIIILLPYLSMYISLPLFAILSEVIYLLGYRYIVNIFLFKIIFLIVSILVVIEGMVLSKKNK